MKNLLSLLCFAALLCASCSIQKRVHQPGYAVEWNLGKRKQHQEPVTRKITARQATATQPMEEPGSQLAFAGNETPALVEPFNEENFIAEPQHAKAPVQTRKAIAQKHNPVQYKAQQPKHNKLHKPQHTGNDDNLLKGFLFILVAILLFGLGLVFASVLGLFGVIFLLIFSIAAAVLLVIGIIMMIVGLVS